MTAPLKFGYLIPTREAVMRAPDGRADIGRMIELAVRAEQGAFDSVWIGDSIFARPRFEALTTLAAITARTQRVELGTAVYLTPLRHPVPLAQTVGNLDLLSGGRFLFGIGIGPGAAAVRAEYAACGTDYRYSGERQEEGLRIMKGLWTGQPFTFEGKHFQIRNATLHPLPARPGGPPVLLAGASERPLRRAAQYGDGWLPISHDPQEFSENWKKLQEYSAQAGRDPAKLMRVLYVTLNVSSDVARAGTESEAFLEGYYGAMHKQIARTQAIFAGEPEACADFIRAFATAGATHFIVRFSSSDQEPQMDRFVAEVVPRLNSSTKSLPG
ncbi:MAG: LLM class flavin-dependent oxidoreductase [Acidobacteria bacterium]|nr:LLM class flavin-dependent oxidoreductase [Acidobacteriota bacterium]